MKPVLFLCAFLVFASSAIIGQNDQGPITKFLLKKGYQFPDSSKGYINPAKAKKWPDTLYYNTAYKSDLMGSITIPISFSSIEIAKGNYEVSPTVSLGLGYTWFWGDFIFNENDKITVDPKVFFGLIANAGLENNFTFNKLAGLFTGGFVGVGSFTLFFGYDIINQSPSLGVGGRIDFYSISQKFLHILGRVREVRKHKKIALPVTRE